MLRYWTRPDTGLKCVLYEYPRSVQAPRLSVLMPVYNGATYLDSAVDSVLAQSFRDFEFVIVDDGSTDRTPVMLYEWVRRDHRIRVLRQPHLGLIDALNTGWLACRAAVIARMDCDDLSCPERFAKQFAALESDSGAAVVTCEATLIDEEGTVIGKTGEWDPANGILALLPRNPIVHGAVMIRQCAVRRNPPYKRPPEDYRLWAELMLQGAKFLHLSDVLYQFRVHAERYSIRSAGSQLEGILNLQLELLRQLDASGLAEKAAREVLAATWESVATAAHATGRRKLASAAHQRSEQLRFNLGTTAPEELEHVVQSYGWARMPWHWYHRKAAHWLATTRNWNALRSVLLNHPLITALRENLQFFPKEVRLLAGRRHVPAARLPHSLLPLHVHGRRVLISGSPSLRLLQRVVEGGPARLTVLGTRGALPDGAARLPEYSRIETTDVPVNEQDFDLSLDLTGPARRRRDAASA